MSREPWSQCRAVKSLSGPIRTRLGVSPNHASFQVGTLRTHLLTAAFAHAVARVTGTGAEVRLRWDDTNSTRAAPAMERHLHHELEIVADIRLRPDAVRQSEHVNAHRRAIGHLVDLGLAWDRCGSVVLDVRATDDHLAARGIDPDGRAAASLVNVGAAPMPQHDTVRLSRSDGTVLWHLASVVDDIDAGVNVVVRGTDKIDATGIQERLRAVLAPWHQVAYLFLPRMLPVPGEPKVRVSELLKNGLSTRALRWFLAETYLLGEEPAMTFDQIVERLRPVLPAPRDSRLDLRRLAALNRKVRRISPAAVPRR